MKVSSRILAATVGVVLFGGIALSAAFNMWSTSPAKEPVRFATGEFAGQANPADIRGSYLLADIEKAFGVPAAVLGKAFGVAADRDPAQFQLKELETLYKDKLPAGQEIGTDSVRMFVALYKGVPHTPEDDTVLPASAAAVLKGLGTLKPDQLAWVDKHTFGAPVSTAAAAPGAPAAAGTAPAVASAAPAAPAPAQPAAHTESTDDRAIKGKTTFGDLMLWGLKKEQIESVIGMQFGAPGVAVRDFLSQKGLEFTTYKTKLQELVDKLPR